MPETEALQQSSVLRIQEEYGKYICASCLFVVVVKPSVKNLQKPGNVGFTAFKHFGKLKNTSYGPKKHQNSSRKVSEI